MAGHEDLVIVGRIDVPEAIFAHRFVQEALQVLGRVATHDDFRERVIGTGTGIVRAQLYGWGKDIAGHTDRAGIIYGVCLNPGVTTLSAMIEHEDGEETVVEVALQPGDVYRLNDRRVHWTRDSEPRLAAFAGPYREPCDAMALDLLRAGMGHLAGGSYYDAPRVSEGFVLLQPDECWASADFEDRRLMLIADAEREGCHILTCSACDRPAVAIDHLWPYHSEGSLCGDCGGSHEDGTRAF